jgi:hypothetical protein
MNPRTAGVVVLAGILGWTGLLWLGVQMFATNPPTAAFDLELLLRAGRDVAAGRSPYDPAIVAGAAPVAERLFYSYPPVVAQVLAPFASVPSSVMFAGWTAAAVASFAAVTVALARRLAPGIAARTVAVTAVAIVPLLFPFAIGLLFGNLDVFFPAVYGLVLLGVLPAATSPSGLLAGAATAAASITKLHPASLGVWLLVRASLDRAARRPLLAAAAVGLGFLAVSVALNPSLWLDYVAVVRAGSGADLVDPRNAGPAAQIAATIGGTARDAEALARMLQVLVSLIALLATVAVAWRLRDPIESLAWAAAASLVTLPVTWYHYPSALLPFAAAALFRSGSQSRSGAATTRALVVGAAIAAAVAIAFLPLLYVAVGLLLAAVRSSASPGDEVTAPALG